MNEATRIGDDTTGTCNPGRDCCPHGRSGINTEGSPDVRISGASVHRIGDTGSCRCPHSGTYKSVAGSSSVRANGKGITRIGDTTRCQFCGVAGAHVGHSSDVRIGD